MVGLSKVLISLFLSHFWKPSGSKRESGIGLLVPASIFWCSHICIRALLLHLLEEEQIVSPENSIRALSAFRLPSSNGEKLLHCSSSDNIDETCVVIKDTFVYGPGEVGGHIPNGSYKRLLVKGALRRIDERKTLRALLLTAWKW